MKRKKIIFSAVALVMAAALTLTACSSTPGPEDSAGDKPAGNETLQEILGVTDDQLALLQGQTLNLGGLFAMTGNGDYYGRVQSSGAELAIKQIEEMTGMKINFFIEDHQSGDVNAGTTGVRSLINKDHVSAILSSYGNVTAAIAPLVGQSQVLTFNPGGADDMQLGYDYLWMGRMLFGTDPMPGIVNYVAETYPEMKKAAVIGLAENGTTVYEKILPKMWPEKSGGEIVLLEKVNVGVTDFSQIITKVKASGAQVIFTTVVNNDIGYLLKQLREANVTIPVFGVELNEQQMELAGAAGVVNYYFGNDYFSPDSANPFAQYFVQEYTAEYGGEPELHAACYYQNVFVILRCMIDVLENGEEVNGSTLQDALKKVNDFPTVYGGEDGTVARMSYVLEDHSTNMPMGIYTMENGKAVKQASIEKIPESEW